ncbi:MAG: Tyrosine recombinase XerC [candidate division WS2 bacterium]|nr:Tyrosine recombinase XerC [Candidatus Lithacetigena glycinireducens]
MVKKITPMRKEERYLYLLPEEWKVIVNTTLTFSIKYGLLWDLIGYSGLRISEALFITPKDFDFKNNIIRVLTLKQREKKFDYVKLPKGIMDILKSYISSNNIQPTHKLWDISRQSAWKMFKKCLKLSNLDKRFTIHGLRHCQGIMVAEITKGDVIKITKRLRQKTVAMALRYTHLTEKINNEIVQGLEFMYPKKERIKE